MAKFTMFYAKSLRDIGHQAPAAVKLSDYTDVGTIEAADAEAVFEEMNIGETRCKLQVRSMSVGDVLVDGDTQAVLYCCSMGWNPVGWTQVNVEG